MKIAFIINSLGGGGAERVVTTLSNYLIQNGYEITIILLEKDIIQYDLDKRVNLVVLKTSRITKGIAKIMFIPLQALELNYILKKIKIDKSISFLTRANLVFSFTKFFSKKNIIISQRNNARKNYEIKSIQNNIMNFLIKRLYKKADKIIAISHGIKDSLHEDYNININKIQVIYNPQNNKLIQNSNTKKLIFEFKKEYKYFITLGRLIKPKDHKTMIEAFHIVTQTYPYSNLIILGDGELKSDIKSLINKLNLTDKVILLGFVKNPFDYLKKADIFVFSSKFEGFGNVLVEAMASGLPVISTDCPSGPAEILENGKYGILTKVENKKELAKAMINMLDTDRYNYFQNKSIERAKDFDITIVAKEYLEILYR